MHKRSPKQISTMKSLTVRQNEILDYIEDYEWRLGHWPSIRDIQEKFCFKSTNAVMGHLRALEKKAMIERIPGQARTFRITRNEPNSSAALPESAIPLVTLPVVGAIAAGYPDRVESAGEFNQLQVDLGSAGGSSFTRRFALEVRGDSMIDADIMDGDIVIIEPRSAADGDIVAALIDQETTLKRYIQKGNEPPYLKAENVDYPELYPVAELEIQGVAKAVVKSL